MVLTKGPSTLLTVVKGGATDERNYVKKAINWALRNIGKRNSHLNRIAIEAAQEIQQIDSRAARWIAANAIKVSILHEFYLLCLQDKPLTSLAV